MRALRLRQDESGVAMITALLGVVILAGLAIVVVSRATTETRVSANSRDHEAAIHVAEAAADNQIRALNADDDHITQDRDGTDIELSPSAVDDEKAWALGLLDDMRPVGGDVSEAWVSGATGEAYAVRPYDEDEGEPLDVIYAVGAVPAFDAPNAKIRVLKLQIAQDQFIPEFALLTGSELKFGGNAAILVQGCDEDGTDEEKQLTCIADVHTNQEFDLSGNSAKIQGRVSQVDGACPPPSAVVVNGCVDASDGVEEKPIPEFVARDFYNRGDELNPDQQGDAVEWYDLCPPGKPDANATVREPGDEPCSPTSTLVWTDDGGTNSQGWRWSNGQWRANGIRPGVYYIYHADARVNQSAGSGHRAVSILVEQDPAAKSSTGSLDVQGNPLMESALQSVLLMVDADLSMQGTPGGTCGVDPGAQAGFIGVGEQLRTQGTVSIRGAIIVRDAAHDHPSVTSNNEGIGGTMCFEFDENLVIDFVGVWVVTFWNEL